eukprot:GSA25T00011417001.1
MQAAADASCHFFLDPIEPPERPAVSSGRVRALVGWRDDKGSAWYLTAGGAKAHRMSAAATLAKRQRNAGRSQQKVTEGEGGQVSKEIIFMNSRRIRDVVQIECMDAESIKANMGDNGESITPKEALTYVTDINVVYGTKLFFQSMSRKIEFLRSELQEWRSRGSTRAGDEYSPAAANGGNAPSRKYSRALSGEAELAVDFATVSH